MSDSRKFSEDGPINIPKEMAAVDARLPIHIDREMPLDITIRVVALGIAQRHVGDTVISEGGLYQQLKMDNKLGAPVSVDNVIHAALVFERFLWGQWSKGIAENAIEKAEGAAAEFIEKMLDEKFSGVDDDPSRPSSGNAP